MLTQDPGVDFFVSFHDLDPHAQKRCIYFVKKDRPDRRCKFECSDNGRAIELHNRIATSESDRIIVDDIKEYIRSNCCAKARHRDLILSSPLLIQLVARWLDEILIKKHTEDVSNCMPRSPTPTTPKRASRADSPAPSTYTTSTSSAPSSTTRAETPLSSPSYSRPNSPKASVVSPSSPQLDASPTPPPRVPTAITPSSTSSESKPSEPQKRYNLRPRALNDAFRQWSEQARLSQIAEFHPHINEPTSEETVAFKFCEGLTQRDYGRDFKTGAVYIYSRKSSPGYVKIGWTSKSVDERLKEWSECGYAPIELFRSTGVPYAQRVETLTHYELIKEWRREQPCKGCRTRKQKQVRHQEWFEVNKERAIEVLSTWAELFRKAQPYDTSGSLKAEWTNIIDVMNADGKAVTSKVLLEQYEVTIVKRKTSPKHVAITIAVPVAEETLNAKVVKT